MSDWNATHPLEADVRFDGGDLDCGNGLLLLIRRHIDPLEGGQHLELQSTDTTVEEDLPAWCRMTGNALVSRTRDGNIRSYLIRKRDAKPTTHSSLSPLSPGGEGPGVRGKAYGNQPQSSEVVKPSPHSHRPIPQGRGEKEPPLPNFAVMGVGSWPRPGWMLRALHDKLSGKLDEERSNDMQMMPCGSVSRLRNERAWMSSPMVNNVVTIMQALLALGSIIVSLSQLRICFPT